MSEPLIIYSHPDEYVWGDLVNDGHRQNWTPLVRREEYDRLREEYDTLQSDAHGLAVAENRLARERDEARALATQLREGGEAMAAWIRDNTCSSDCGDNCQAGAAALEAWLAVFDAKEKTDG